MDLRLVTFNLIFDDATLRDLLIAHADQVEHGHAADQACFLALTWMLDGGPGAPTDFEVLRAQAHLPRQSSSEHSRLDFVLRRLWTIFAVNAADGRISARCRGSGHRLAKSGAGTVFKTATFEIMPGPLDWGVSPPALSTPGALSTPRAFGEISRSGFSARTTDRCEADDRVAVDGAGVPAARFPRGLRLVPPVAARTRSMWTRSGAG